MGAFAMILLENALLPDEALVSDELKLVLALIAGGALWFVTTQAEHLIVQIFGAAAGTAVGAMVYNVAAHLAFVADEGCDDGWPRACERLTGYTDVELYPCCKAISYHINRAAKDDAKRQLVACKKKFSRHDFSTVSFGKCPVLKRPKLIDLPDLAD